MEVGDEPTWVGTPKMLAVPRITTLGPAPQLHAAPLPMFEVPVRGSVTEGMPLESTGTSPVLCEGTGTARQIARPEVVEASAPEPIAVEPRRMSFGARVALWTIGLAASGAAVGAALALALR